jgi:hypothetical protein
MHTISRQQLCHIGYSSLQLPKPQKISVTSDHFHKLNGKWIHVFKLGSNLSIEMFAPSSLWSYKVKVTSEHNTKVRFYSLIEQTMQYMVDIEDKLCQYNLMSGIPTKFIANFKVIILVSKNPTPITISLEPISYRKFNYRCYSARKKMLGHRLIVPYYNHTVIKIREKSLKHALPRFYVSNTEDKTIKVFITQYYLNLSSIITVTTDKQNSYPPYSIKLYPDNHIILKYHIVVKASAGDNAKISVTAIETQSSETYSIIQNDGKNLTNEHQGLELVGQFVLPDGCPDVGLHIYTPYGFSGSIHDNKYKDLAKFKQFDLIYT